MKFRKKQLLWIGGCILAACVIGIIVGIPMSFLAVIFSDAARAAFRREPGRWVAHGIAMGVYLSVLAYFFMGIMTDYVLRIPPPSSDPEQPERASTGRNFVLTFLGVIFAAGVLFGAMALGATSEGGEFLRISITGAMMGVIIGQMMGANAHEAVMTSRRSALRAQIKTLQAQINPHFFFNTLNSISSLIPDDPQGALRMIGLLADMSRYSFAGIQSEFVPLVDELKFARDYLEIERIRFGDRLRFELPEADAADKFRIPALTLQPLIENAIRHGISKLIDGGRVHVGIERKGEMFSVTVENDIEAGSAPPAEEFFKPGHALHNIRQRVRYYYPRRVEHLSWIPRRGLVERTPRGSVEVTFPRPDAVAVTITASQISIYDSLRSLHPR